MTTSYPQDILVSSRELSRARYSKKAKKRLSEKKKELLRAFCDFCCEECHQPQSKVGNLQPHRIKQGGDYSLRNIKMCCDRCHKIFSSAQNKAWGIA